MKRDMKLGMGGLVLVAICLLCPPAQAASVLIVGADDSPPTAELLARGFTTVDVSMSTTPSLATLLAYDAVLAYTNSTHPDPTGLGNVLADYADAGRRVVISTYSLSVGWALGGRIMTAGYSPLVNVGINGDVSGALVATVPGDPIFLGITPGAVGYFHNSNFAHPGLDAGATLLATDGAGIDMIARNAAGNVIGLNLFPATGHGSNAEFFDLVANSLRTGAPVPEPLTMFGAFMGLSSLGIYIRKRIKGQAAV